MPGELANILAGRVANLFNLRGPNFITDAACASAMAAAGSRARGAGGAATSTRCSPAASTATWGPGLREVLQDRRAVGDRHPAVRRRGRRVRDGRGGGRVPAQAAGRRRARRRPDLRGDPRRRPAPRDGRGKGITAPNPIGQRLAMERAWRERRGSRPPPRRSSRATAPRPGSATWSRWRAWRGLRRRRRAARLDPPRLGEVEHRPPQGGGRRGRPVEDGLRPAR